MLLNGSGVNLSQPVKMSTIELVENAIEIQSTELKSNEIKSSVKLTVNRSNSEKAEKIESSIVTADYIQQSMISFLKIFYIGKCTNCVCKSSTIVCLHLKNNLLL